MITFTKLSGTGNTFLFFDARDEAAVRQLYSFIELESRSKIARILCDPYHSIGADGLVFVENSVEKRDNSAEPTIGWDFYNADGSAAEMCGNAARCMAIYSRAMGINENPFRFQTRAGVIETEILENGEVDVTMPEVSDLFHDQMIKLKKKNYSFTSLNTGVPHAVIEQTGTLVKGMDEPLFRDLADIDRLFKGHRRFRPDGTNVTFFKVNKPGAIESLTFERGVRGYTQACGTGAVAAAISYKNTKKYKGEKVHLTLPGGRVVVDLSKDRPHLIGPAKVIAKITLSR